jgi:hypothetical protein
MSEVLTMALRYAMMEWQIFPAPPATKKSYKSAAQSQGRKWGMTADPEEIKADWERWPDANVGIPTGKINGIWVLEADTHVGHGVDGVANLKELEALHGALPKTRMAKSPSGSVHYYWRWIEGMEVRNSASKVAPGVDVRGEGGMVIAPPSTKPNQGRYVWLEECDPVNPPQWLLVAVMDASRRTARNSLGASQQMDLDRLQAAIRVIPNEDVDWESWNKMGMALYSATKGNRDGYSLFDEWSKKSQKYNGAVTLDKWDAYHRCPPNQIAAGTIYFMATEASPGWDRFTEMDFAAFMPDHSYVFIPTRDFWPASSVNAIVSPRLLFDARGNPITNQDGTQKRIKTSTWLDRNRRVEQATWAPGHQLMIENNLVAEGGWLERRGAKCFNLYRGPNIVRGDTRRVGPWFEHADRLLGSDRDHVLNWFAHRVQRPGEKINHALVLGGKPGIGKDTLLEPLKRAVGGWNFVEVNARDMLGNFNGYLKSVVLRVSEVRDLGEFNRFQFYEHMKTYLASPPDVLRINEKNVKEFYVFNVVGVVYTTNHKQGGMYLPSDDRRHYVAWSDLSREDFDENYWDDIWDYYDTGGDSHVAEYLMQRNINGFDAKAAPPRTEAFWEIAVANDLAEDAELADAIDRQETATFTVEDLSAQSDMSNGQDIYEWLKDRRNRRVIPIRLERCGYVAVRNPDATDGVWRVNGKRVVIYTKSSFSRQGQIDAARSYKAQKERTSQDTIQ